MRAVVMHEPGNVTVEELTDGLGADGVVSLDMDRMFFAEVHMFGGPAAVRKYLPAMIDLIFGGEINPGAVFDLVLPLERAAEGYAAWMSVAQRRSC